jgi:PKD repeat protein
VFVSGLGGRGIRDQLRCLPATYPYGCSGEWASIYTASQGADEGALFIEFYVDGNPRKGRGYFKDISGEVIDQFTIWSGQPSGPPNMSPVVTAGGDTSGAEGSTVSVAAAFTDADMGDTHTATVDWGDGTGAESGSVTEVDGSGTVAGSHAYADDAIYTVTVTVDDGRGGVTGDSYEITVTNVAPTAVPGGPYASVEGTSVSFSGDASDPGADTFTFEWDFDYDGSVFDVATPSSPSAGAQVTFTDQSTSHDGITTWAWDFDVDAGASIDSEVSNPTHTYEVGGSYTVRLTVSEADGDASVFEGQVVVTEEPSNTPPTATDVTITGSAQVGGQLTGSYTYSDEDGDPEAGSTYRWLRDGEPITGATELTYVLEPADEGSSIAFEVTPEATTGASPGTPVQSPQTAPVTGAPLEVTGVSPGGVDAGSQVNVTITGSGFDPEVSVTLENGSGPRPEVSNVTWQNDSTITATITARSGGPRRDRPWDMRGTNPDGTSVVVVGGLTVSGAR